MVMRGPNTNRTQIELERTAWQLLEKLGDEESARLFRLVRAGVESIRDQLQSVKSDMVSDNELPTSPEAVDQLLQHFRVRVSSH